METVSLRSIFYRTLLGACAFYLAVLPTSVCAETNRAATDQTETDQTETDQTEASFDSDVRPLLKQYCFECHRGEDASGDVDLFALKSGEDLLDSYEIWESVAELLRDGSMPPEDEPQPSTQQRKQILDWYQHHFIDSVEPHPGYFRPRRLAAHEYRNTLHSIVGFSLEVTIMEAEQTDVEKSLVMKLLPTDPPGKSGFKNDTSGNPLTTNVWDQYSYLADVAIRRLLSKAERPTLESLVGPVGQALSADQAKSLIRVIATRAYRRPAGGEVIQRSIAAIDNAATDESGGVQLDQVVRTELKAILMSPRFFYRGLMMETPVGQEVAVDNFELAERVSYFLWADRPDDELIRVAAAGGLSESDGLNRQIDRMLDSPKARRLAEHLGVEWFSLDEIDHVSDNPPYRDALKSQPIDFLHYLFTGDRPITELIDSETAFVNAHTAKFYPGDRAQLARYQKLKGIEVERLPNQRLTLAKSTHRGGILTMPGVLAMNRGPILRGTWMLERILGEHLPEPPANVGQVKANAPGEELSFRQRFELHRADATCAVCHDKIDPLGFSLGFYNDAGAHLVHEKPKPNKKNKAPVSVDEIDPSGRLPSGETFRDFQELKEILVTRKRKLIVRNVVERFLSYAVCRKLEYYDRPEIDRMTNKLVDSDGAFRDLVYEICNSLPVRRTVVREVGERKSEREVELTSTPNLDQSDQEIGR